MTPMQTFDPVFEAWLQTLPALGYDRHWVRHNVDALETKYRETGGAPMKPCPPPSAPAYDPYLGL